MPDTSKDEQWNTRFLEVCQTVASWSDDRDRHVGAVIFGPGQVILATGYNGLPRGVSGADNTRYDRKSGEKFFWVEHAERNAIYNAARTGTALQSSTIVINRFPCADCARAIIQSGISEVVSPPPPKNDGALDHSFDVAEVMLREAGIAIKHPPQFKNES
ncbi:deaminase [Pseudovibrio sp. Tun.PSC04-5.I4]|uniref:deoxycytidylate deaminase n=1 Tax=Pseudovibrio sp. Tun.PSC04-5.I4 TaxID=1798213 RepID=UPI000882514A|nr:deaminase [Pseudovibrio sp. Tun.PSC04-5.I4]SDR00548.1 dCMP deaminase [Pseudovibrio sp. Tun.PSC04-5.I4]